MCALEVLVIKTRPHLALVEGTKVAMFAQSSAVCQFWEVSRVARTKMHVSH